MHDVTNTLSLLSASEIQKSFAIYLKQQRKIKKLSRSVLAERSTVPMTTIKKFETTGKISLRQLLLLWQSLDDLNRLHALLNPVEVKASLPKTIDEVLGS